MPKEPVSSRAPRRTSVRARKAPTTLRATAADEQMLRRKMLISIGVFVLVSFSSVGIGVADEGQIDVGAVIDERNQAINAENQDRPEGQKLETVRIPRQGQTDSPDGGLQGLGKSAAPPPPMNTGSSTATSTAADSATSTKTTSEGSQESATEETSEETPPEASE